MRFNRDATNGALSVALGNVKALAATLQDIQTRGELTDNAYGRLNDAQLKVLNAISDLDEALGWNL